MPEISRFYGIIIKMYFSDHNPPHFHVEYNSYKAEVEIDTLNIKSGEIPKRVYLLVLEWAINHKVELKRNWELTKSNQQPIKIDPLD